MRPCKECGAPIANHLLKCERCAQVSAEAMPEAVKKTLPKPNSSLSLDGNGPLLFRILGLIAAFAFHGGPVAILVFLVTVFIVGPRTAFLFALIVGAIPGLMGTLDAIWQLFFANAPPRPQSIDDPK